MINTYLLLIFTFLSLYETQENLPEKITQENSTSNYLREEYYSNDIICSQEKWPFDNEHPSSFQIEE